MKNKHDIISEALGVNFEELILSNDILIKLTGQNHVQHVMFKNFGIHGNNIVDYLYGIAENENNTFNKDYLKTKLKLAWYECLIKTGQFNRYVDEKKESAS